MTRVDILHQGSEAFAQRRWADAYEHLSAADRETPMDPDDLEKLADAAHLTGRIAEGADFRARAYHDFLSRGDVAGAVRCAFWQGMHLMQRGEMAPAMGWFARGQQALDESGLECVERAYVLVPPALQKLFGGDPESAYETFEEIAAIANRFGDPGSTALSCIGRGQALVALGRANEGVAMLDEAMLAVTTRAVSPIVAGIVYCAVIAACHECFDMRRAREWTLVLTEWCDSQQDLVPFRGQCLVHRAQILQFNGAWPDALTEAERARKWMTETLRDPAVGLAHYVLGELLRLRGDVDGAEEAYREANRYGHIPQPGLALLRLAEGQIEAAAATIRRLLEETGRPTDKARFLPAAAEILLAAGDVAGARTASEELSQVAASLDVPLVHAAAKHAVGAVLLAEGDAHAALDALRRAWRAWHELEAPYEAAQARVLTGLALRALSDEDAAALELDAARSVFDDLGAVPAAVRVEGLVGGAAVGAPGGLTTREVEVLRLVASGKTNRAIAGELVLSEKTVERHLSNIFTKLGVSSRSAATAFAYEHDLVQRR